MNRIIEAAFAVEFRLLVAEQTIIELQRTVTTKPYFTARVTTDELVSFVQALQAIADILSHPIGEVSAVVRDPADDVILAQAIFGEADYLVTGDRDLLDIAAQFDRPQIVQPAAFVRDVLRRDRP